MSEPNPEAPAVTFPPINMNGNDQTVMNIKAKRNISNNPYATPPTSSNTLNYPQPLPPATQFLPHLIQPHPSFQPAMVTGGQTPLTLSQQYAALSNGFMPPLYSHPPPPTIPIDYNAQPPPSSNPANPASLPPRSRGQKVQSSAQGQPPSQPTSGGARPGMKRAKTKDELLAEQLAATDELGRKRSAKVEALKRAAEDAEHAARVQAAAVQARKKAALEKAREERLAKEQEQKAKEAEEAVKVAAERKKKLDELRARQAAKAKADEERKAREAEEAKVAEEKRAKQEAERRKVKEAEMAQRIEWKNKKKQEQEAAQSAEAATLERQRQERAKEEDELKQRQQNLTELERLKSQSIQEAEQKLASLQASIATAAKNRDALAAETERKKKAAEEEAAQQKVKQRQKEERLKFEMEAKIKRKLEWNARRAQTVEQVKADHATAATAAAAATSTPGVASSSSDAKDATVAASPKPAPSTARSRAKAASIAASASAHASLVTSPRRPVVSTNTPSASLSSPRRPRERDRGTASTTRARILRRSVVPMRRVGAAASPSRTKTATAASWTPAMAKEMTTTWTFLFQTYGNFLPPERIHPCVAALVASRAHPRDAVDFTHQELHEMNVQNWRTRKDILDTTRSYLRKIQTAYVQNHGQGTKVLFDDQGQALNTSSIQRILDDQIARGESSSSVQNSPFQSIPPLSFSTSSSPSAIPFDPMLTHRPQSSLGLYAGPLFDASGLPIDLADIAVNYLKQQMDAAKHQAALAKAEAASTATAVADSTTAPLTNAPATTVAQPANNDDEVTLLTIGGQSPSTLSSPNPANRHLTQATHEPLDSSRSATSFDSSPTPSAASSSMFPLATAYVPPTPKSYSIPMNQTRPPLHGTIPTGATSASSSSNIPTGIPSGPSASPASAVSPSGKPKLTYAQMMAQRYAKKDDSATTPNAAATAPHPSTVSHIPISSGAYPTPPIQPQSTATSYQQQPQPPTPTADDDVIMLPIHSSTAAAASTSTPIAPAVVVSSTPSNLDSTVLSARGSTPPAPGRVYKLFGKKK